MKVIFNSTTLGGGPNYFLNTPEDLEPDLENIVVDVPRTDFYRNVDDFLQQEIKKFEGTLVGDDQEDYRTKRRNWRNLLRQEFEFQLVDSYIDEQGAEQTVETYYFTGKIIDVKFKNETSNTGEYSMLVALEDPYMYVVDGTSPQDIPIDPIGFAFPIGVPLTFSEGTNSIDITNPSEHPMYIDVVLHGQATNVRVYNITNGEIERFDYDGVIADGDTVEITPQPSDAIKVRSGGISKLSLTNGNFDVFVVQAGETSTFRVFAEDDINANAEAVFTYRIPYLAP